MNETAERAHNSLDNAITQQKKEMTEFIRENLHSELSGILEKYVTDMEQARMQMAEQTKAFNTYLRMVNTKNRQLAFKSWIAVAASLLLLLTGGIWLSYYYIGVIGKNKTDADTARLMNEADVYRCGDRLCAKTGKAQKNGYRPVLTR